MKTSTDFLWVERYRPQTIKDCILPQNLESTFQEMVKLQETQNLLFYGTAGVGKTTVAKALCNETQSDWIMINCSEDGNIDTLRTKIRQFASTVSLTQSKKVVILDEFDYSNANSIQPALRGAIEEFANNCRFILTCNYKSKIIEPIHSRCTGIDFTIPKTEKPEVAKRFLRRLEFILKTEQIQYDKAILSQLVLKHFPDFRRIINELQRYSVSGSIDAGILSNLEEIELKDLFQALREKNFNSVRKWVALNSNENPTELFRRVYDSLQDVLVPQTIPNAITLLADYQYKSAFVADQEINIMAFLIELMVACEFK
jgi:DNA polymerase III delta prime subunit